MEKKTPLCTKCGQFHASGKACKSLLDYENKMIGQGQYIKK